MTTRFDHKTWRIGPALLALACLLSLLAPGALAAAEGVDSTSDAVEISENGTVLLRSDHIAVEKVASLQLQLSLGDGGVFTVSPALQDGSRITYVSGAGTVRIYIAGPKALLESGDSLVLGTITGCDPKTADFVDGSLKYVYGSTIRAQAAANLEGESIVMEGLKNLIAEAEAVDGTLYTADSYGALQTALDAAKAVLYNTAATDDDLQAAADMLRVAIDSLLPVGPAPSGPSKEALQAAVDAVAAYAGREAEFTKTSWETFFAALVHANEVLEKLDATAEEIEAAAQALIAAQAGLKPSGKGELEAAVAEAEALLEATDESQYTPESVKALKDALAAAQAVLADAAAGEAEWAAALSALTDAKRLIPVGKPDPDDPIPEGGETGDQQTSPSPSPTPTPTATATATTAPTATAAVKTAPNTGDGTDALPWALALLGCAAALVLLAGLRRKQER